MPRSPVPWSVVIAVLQSTLYVYVCVRVCYERGVSNERCNYFAQVRVAFFCDATISRAMICCHRGAAEHAVCACVCVRVCYERGVSNELIDAFVRALPGGYGFPPGCRIHCCTAPLLLRREPNRMV